jgi:hypothetical protein
MNQTVNSQTAWQVYVTWLITLESQPACPQCCANRGQRKGLMGSRLRDDFHPQAAQYRNCIEIRAERS